MLDQVRKLFEEAEVTIPDAVLDRAHVSVKIIMTQLLDLQLFATEH